MIMNYIRTVLVSIIITTFFTDIYGQVNFTSSDIPIVIINTNGQEILDDPRIIAEMQIVNNANGLRNSVSGPFNAYTGNISIEIRGSTSQSFPKKQYAFETCDSSGDNINVSLLGLPKENDWILYAPYTDKTLIRNALAYDLARKMGQYASHTRFCELVLNDEYMGIYILLEKIKRDDSRVNISRLTTEDIDGDPLTGGYILKLDKKTNYNGETFYSSFSKRSFQYHYPDCDEIMPEQKTYIQQYIYDFEEALFSTDFQDPQNGYYRFIDMNSFIDYMIVNEIAKNIDAYFLSTFIYKERDSKGGKLHMGPVWDFNIAFGNAYYYGGYHSDSLVIYNHPWWPRLLEDSVYNIALRSRWDEYRSHSLSNTSILSTIDSLANLLTESCERNFIRWDILGHKIWPNYFVGDSYIEEINYLKKWIIDRVYWLDKNFSGTSDIQHITVKNILKLYPNPFHDNLTIILDIEEPVIASIKIYDMMGHLQEVIVSEEFYDRGVHQLSKCLVNGSSYSLKRGVYIVVLENDNQPISRFRVVKN